MEFNNDYLVDFDIATKLNCANLQVRKVTVGELTWFSTKLKLLNTKICDITKFD